MTIEKYVFVNPLKGVNYGIATYINQARSALSNIIETDVIHNINKLNRVDFQYYVLDALRKFNPETTLFEFPETYAASLYVNNVYKIHVRCHLPLAYAQEINNQKIDEVRFQQEMQVIRQARCVSSPSLYLRNRISKDSGVEEDKIFHYRNPIIGHLRKEIQKKKYDLLFVGRNELLKGANFLPELAAMLGADFKIAVVGQRLASLNLPSNCINLGELDNSALKEVYKSSDAIVSLSPYENCSMVVLESLKAKLKIYAWNTGGTKEIAPEPMIRVVNFGDVAKLADLIRKHKEDIVVDENYDNAIGVINNEFVLGVKRIISNQEISANSGVPYIFDPKTRDTAKDDILTIVTDNWRCAQVKYAVDIFRAKKVYVISPESLRLTEGKKITFIENRIKNKALINVFIKRSKKVISEI